MTKLLWKEKGYPHKGWHWVGVEDTGEPSQHCEFCGTEIRYVHIIEHDDIDSPVEVGCICAETLTEDYVNPRGKEKSVKRNNRAKCPQTKENVMLMPMSFEGEVKPLTAGTYAARIVTAEGKTSAKGNPYINWALETFGSPEVNGKRVFHTTPTTGGYVTKLAELHKAATGQDIDKKAKQYDPEMLIGKELTITVVEESYPANDGTQKTRVAVKSVSKLN